MKNHKYGYARVSSKDQNASRQIEALKSAGVMDKDIFIDKTSGKNFDREQYKNLIAQLKKGNILIIKSIDRLGRNYNEIIQEWKSLTKELKVDIKVIDLPLLDTTQSGRDLTGTFIADIVLQILSYVAEQERVNIKQRQAEGIALAKQQGKYLGRPPIKRPLNFDEIYDKWINKSISSLEAMKKLGLKKSTFYKLISEQRHLLQKSGEHDGGE